MAFCKEFNARTQAFKVSCAAQPVYGPGTLLAEPTPAQDDVPLPVLVTAYKDKSFDFVRRSAFARAPGQLLKLARDASRS